MAVHQPSPNTGFNPLTILLGWLYPQMTRPICLPAYVVFLIQTSDQLLIGFTSQCVDRQDCTIKKAKKVNTNKGRTEHGFITIIFSLKKSVFKNGTHIPPSLGLYSQRPSSQIKSVNFLAFKVRPKASQFIIWILGFSILAFYSLTQSNLKWWLLLSFSVFSS